MQTTAPGWPRACSGLRIDSDLIPCPATKEEEEHKQKPTTALGELNPMLVSSNYRTLHMHEAGKVI